MNMYLKLFVTGSTARSNRAISTMTSICAALERQQMATKLEIIDVLEHPELAEINRILATPTLIRCAPEPRRRIIGDLSNVQVVVDTLGLVHSLPEFRA